MGFAFSPSCCCGGCSWFSWVYPTDNPAAFYAQATILEGSYWDSSGGFVRWRGSSSAGSTGRILLNGASTTEEMFVRLEFESLPGGSEDCTIRVYPDCNGTPGPLWAEVRTGGSGHSTVTGSESKEIVYPWNPAAGATMEICVQKQPNSGGQHYMTLVWNDASADELAHHSVETLTDLIATAPTGKRVIIEVTSSTDVVFSSITAQNHVNGATTCVDCQQDCGCPSCTMTVTIGGVTNDSSATFACADDGNEDQSAAICSNANRQYALPGYNMPYAGLTQCFWLDCIPLLTDETQCHVLIVVRMAFDPSSGVTSVTAVIAIATDPCVNECAIPNSVTSISDVLETMTTCGSICSTAVFSATSESGGDRVGCGFLEDLELTLDPANPELSSYVTDGHCCKMSSATFTINTTGNDCGESSEAPGVQVTGTGGNVVGCSSAEPDPSNGTDFGMLAVGSSASTTFTIHNTGDEDLHISTVTITGSSDFSITSNVGSTTISAGGSETFTVEYTPSVPTVDCNIPETAWLEFATDAFGVRLCYFEVQGTSTSGTIGVTDSGAHAVIYTTTPTTTNHTDFGTVALGSGLSNTFTITNVAGGGDLALGVVSLSGADPGDFQITAQPGSTLLAPSGTTTFTVKFAPLLSGTRTATVVIPNSGCSFRAPFFMYVRGEATGTDPTTPPDCPFSGKTAYVTLSGFPSGGCPGCDGTYAVTFNASEPSIISNCNACKFQAGPFGDCAYDFFVLITFCFDGDGNPATYITVEAESFGGLEVDLNWDSPALLSGAAGSGPLILSGWLTTITSLSLGPPTSIGISCDPSAITATLTIS